MAQRTLSTAGMSSTSQSTIDALKLSMVSGAQIKASDINSLITIWNNFSGHYHGVTDLYGLYDFGDGINNPNGYVADPGSYDNDVTNSPVGLNGSISGVSIGGSITAAKHNELRDAVAGGLNHYHTWDDRTS